MSDYINFGKKRKGKMKYKLLLIIALFLIVLPIAFAFSLGDIWQTILGIFVPLFSAKENISDYCNLTISESYTVTKIIGKNYSTYWTDVRYLNQTVCDDFPLNQSCTIQPSFTQTRQHYYESFINETIDCNKK